MKILNEYEKALEIHTFILKATGDFLLKEPNNRLYHSIFQVNFDDISNLGSSFSNKGLFMKSKSCSEIQLLISLQLLQTNSKNLAYQSYLGGALNNLGNLLFKIGNFEEAKKRFEEALTIYEDILKENPENLICQPTLGTIFDNLGNVLSSMGRLEESKQMCEKALEMREKLLRGCLKIQAIFTFG